MIQGQNFQYENPEDFITVENGDIFFMCNFCQAELDTVIFAGKQNLYFVRCNMENVKIAPSWKTDGMCFTRKAQGGGVFGRHAQTNLLTKPKMETIASQITHKRLLRYKRHAINDISKNYVPLPKQEITIGD